MSKTLVVDHKKCVSCRLCETACSFMKNKTFAPSRARLQVVTYEEEGVSIPIVCYQCEDAPCAKVCPKNAIKRSEKTLAWKVDYDLCIGCKLCVMACPFGNMTFDRIGGTVIKCDRCEGSPQCAEVCPYHAIEYKEEITATNDKKKLTAERFKSIDMEVV